MYIKQTWKNKNTDLTSIEVRRSQSFETVTDSEVYLTLPGDQEYFIDEQVNRDEVYFYRLKFIRGDDFVWGGIISRTATLDVGPGSQILLSGDMDMGVFGVQEDFASIFNVEELRLELARTVDSSFIKTKAPTWGFKYVNKGRVCFLVNAPASYNYTVKGVFTDIATRGLAGRIGEEVNGTPQGVVITVDERNYMVRFLDMRNQPVSHVGYPTLSSLLVDEAAADLSLNSLSKADNEYTRIVQRSVLNGTPSGWGGMLDRVNMDLSRGLDPVNQRFCVSMHNPAYLSGVVQAISDTTTTAWAIMPQHLVLELID